MGNEAFNLAEAVQRCCGRYSLFQEMVKSFLEDVDPTRQRIRTALEQGNAREMATAAHRLKGTLVYLSASAATEAARRVEQIGKSGNLTEAPEALDELEKQLQRLQEALAPHGKGPSQGTE